MKGYQGLGIQLRLKRVEAGLHQKTLALLLGGATQALISWWESGRYMPGPRYLPKVNQLLSLDPLALRVYVLASGLQQPRRHRHKNKPSDEVLKMDQNGGRPSRRVNGRRPCPVVLYS
jgi:transcriptional regulator with XRE-family HTH domain